MTRPSKRTRSEAAWICGVAASNPEISLGEIAMGASLAAIDLALLANGAARCPSAEHWRESHAEAQSMLMCGWSPSVRPASERAA
jgi:hypothetical protein